MPNTLYKRSLASIFTGKTRLKTAAKATQQGHAAALHAFLINAKAKDTAWGRRKRKIRNPSPFSQHATNCPAPYAFQRLSPIM